MLRFNRATALLAAALLALTATLAWAAPGSPLPGLLAEPRRGYDPLSVAEQDLGRSAALRHAAVAALTAASPRFEVLLIERHPETKAVMQSGDWPRRADVYLYLYTSDTLVHAVVDLADGTVDEWRTARNIQLPLTAAEAARAVAIALADGPLAAALQREYRAVTGQRLIDAGRQLVVAPIVFRADAQPARAVGGSVDCGAQRCAQLLISTADGVVVDLSPIVNLSSESVVSAGAFFQD